MNTTAKNSTVNIDGNEVVKFKGCDTEVFFQSIVPGEYDEATGDYGDDIVSEEKRYASVTDTGTETMNLVYGSIKQGISTCMTI